MHTVHSANTIIIHMYIIFVLPHSEYYRIAGNFRGRKLSRISRFSRHPRKFSPRNSRHATPIMRPVLTFRESFLREMLLSYRSAKVFSLENLPLCGILAILYTLSIVLLLDDKHHSNSNMTLACTLDSYTFHLLKLMMHESHDVA